MAAFVSARLLGSFLRHLALQRIDVDALVGDLPIEWGDDASRTALVAWDDVAELGARLERTVGGVGALEELGAAIASSRPMPAIRRLAGWTSSPTALYRIALRWLDLHMPRDVSTAMAVRDDGRIEVRVVMPQGSRSCRPFLHMLAGAGRALPSLIDLPEALVDGRISASSATYVVTPPASGGLLRRALRSVRTFLGSNEAIEDLEHERHMLRGHVDRLERALFESSGREATLRGLLSASDELLLEVGADGRIEAASDAARRLIGATPEQIVGSHVTLWLHRDDDAAVRALLARAFDGELDPPLSPVRARHEDGRWIDVRLDVRGPLHGGDVDRVVVAMSEALGARDGDAGRARLAERLRSLERRHHELRTLHAQVVEHERAAVTARLADLIEASITAALHPLAEALDVAAHKHPDAQAELSALADLAHRVDAGLERTLATLRRAGPDQTPQPLPTLADRLRGALTKRLDELAATVHVDRGDATVDAWVHADPALASAAFECLAEHVARSTPRGGHVEASLDACPDEGQLRVSLRCVRGPVDAPDPAQIAVDLEVARGLLRAQGGDLVSHRGGFCGEGVELILRLDGRLDGRLEGRLDAPRDGRRDARAGHRRTGRPEPPETGAASGETPAQSASRSMSTPSARSLSSRRS